MQKIIVTLTDVYASFYIDVEILDSLVIEYTKKEIMRIANMCLDTTKYGNKEIYFICKRTNKRLVETKTFMENGVWNGDYLYMFEK